MRRVVFSLVLLLSLLAVADAPALVPPSRGSLPPGIAASPAGAHRLAAARVAVKPSAFPGALPAANLAPCGDEPGGLCGTLAVPLDRDDPNGAQIELGLRVYPRADDSRPALGTILMTAGGPGVSATVLEPFGQLFLWEPLLDRRDLVLLDYRGTGPTSAIDCPRIQNDSAADIYAAVAECGQQLGDTSDLYGSDDVAADVEAARAALGIDEFDYYGLSYAALDAAAYAVRHPDRLRSVVLDSPFPPHYDTLGSPTARALVTVVTRLCRRSEACRHDQADPAGSLADLAKDLRAMPVTGTGFDSLGDPHDVTITESTLVKMLKYDLGGYTAQTEIPAAERALDRGDPAPLVRLAAEVPPALIDYGAGPAEEFSAGLNVARFCADNTFQWDKSAPLATRQAQFAAAKSALAKNRFAPFSVNGWLSPPPEGAAPDPCIFWPAPTHVRTPPVPPGATVRVPALILAGDLDLGLPPETARSVRRVFTNARFVEVKGSGHVTAFHANGDCARELIRNFVATGSPGTRDCAARAPVSFPGVGRFPLTTDEVVPAKKASNEDRSTATDRRYAAAAAATVTDAFRRAFIFGPTDHGRGLRGGFVNYAFDDAGVDIDVALDKYVEDLAITGRGRYDFETSSIDATVAIVVPGSFGQVQVTGVWFGVGPTTLLIDGQIGGRRVVLRVPAS